MFSCTHINPLRPPRHCIGCLSPLFLFVYQDMTQSYTPCTSRFAYIISETFSYPQASCLSKMADNFDAAGSIAKGVRTPLGPTKLRDCSNTVSRSQNDTAVINTLPLKKPSSHTNADGWKKNALDFLEQIFQEVKRLIQIVEDEATSKKARDILRQAWIPHANRQEMTPEKFLEKAQQVVALLQRVELPHPAVPRPPPT